MRKPPFQRWTNPRRHSERGVTMVLVAVAMMTIIAMAALSIDVVTLYVSREEAQRAADAAALAAARVISVSGITGAADPDTDAPYWKDICGGNTATANLAAIAAAQVNSVGGSAPTVLSIKYSAQGAVGGLTDCSTLATAFAVNPTVTVQVKSATLPTLFSRIWSRSARSVSATAMAEAFNPSDSGIYVSGGEVVPVVPHCVKPWIVPNADPISGSPLITLSTGAIANPAIVTGGSGSGIGENFTLQESAYCTGANCLGAESKMLPKGTYIPALVSSPGLAAPSCATGDYQTAIAGCDESTVYACGTPSGAQADLTFNPSSDVYTAVQCLTGLPSNNDTIDVTSYPFKITAGSGTLKNDFVTSSNSIMTLPIYDSTNILPGVSQPQVTIVGFLQVFVTNVDSSGNMNVYILNIAGCGNNTPTQAVPGTSPVPIRLITPQ